MTYAPRLPAYAHQAECLERMRGKPYALLMETGAGKSKPILDEYGEDCAAAGGLWDLFIVAPAGCYMNWAVDKNEGQPSEFRRHLEPGLFARLKVFVWKSGMGVQSKRALRAFLDCTDQPRTLVMNVEALSSVKVARDAAAEFLARGRATMAVDECFAAGTEISTPRGYVQIQELKQGDLVTTSCGSTPIKRLLCKQSTVIVELKLSNGKILHMTPNHPIFTDVGWVCAGNSIGRTLFNDKEVSNLREHLRSFNQSEVGKEILREILFSEMEDGTARGESCGIHASSFPKIKRGYEKNPMSDCRLEQGDTLVGRDKEKSERDPEEKWSHFQSAGWEWSEITEATATFAEGIGLAMDTGIRHSLGRKAAWLSNLLQGRFSPSFEKMEHRMRWLQSQQLGSQGKGQKEKREAGQIRVESIEVKQFQSPITVYDLELEGTPHFFAEGVLVHNSTRIKSHKSERTKNVTALGKLAKKRRILTGLVVPNSPLDLYSQFYFLDPRILGHWSFFTFRARYAIMRDMPVGEWFTDPRTQQPTRRTAKVVVAYRNEGELNKMIEPYSYRVLKKDCLDLPEKIYAPPHSVELTAEQRRIYEEIKENATAELESGSWVSATEVMTQMLRLQQVLCGFVKDENGEEHAVPSNRLKVLLEILEDHAGKAIIWTRFDRCVREIGVALEQSYGQEAVALFWGANRNVRAEEEKRFLSDPACRFMVSTPASGGYGNTWTVATLSIYHDNDFDLEHRVQSEDRNHRVGQHNPVTYADLIVPGTMDEKVVAKLRAKIDVAAAIMGDGPRSWII